MSMAEMAQGRAAAPWFARWGQAARARFARPATQTGRATLSPLAAAQRFEHALAADSNIAADWLACAELMTGVVERRYCLHRALVIDPDSEWATRQLNALNARRR
jgi:hypothetical protein